MNSDGKHWAANDREDRRYANSQLEHYRTRKPKQEIRVRSRKFAANANGLRCFSIWTAAMRLLVRQEPFLAFDAPAVASERAIGPYYAMTRHNNPNWI